MKLAFAAALCAAAVSLAPSAFADGVTTATLGQPVEGKIQFIAHESIWDCSGTTCVSVNAPDNSFSVSQCHDVARKVGPIVDFSSDYKETLAADKLGKCNAGLKPTTTASAR
jgi:hypothetical protein